MNRKYLGALLGATALALSGVAHAATTISFSSYQITQNPGEAIVTGFETGAAPIALSNVLFSMPGYAITGTASLLTGSSGLGAAPAMSMTTSDPTQYLSVQGGQFANITTPSLMGLSFYVGSLDGYNSVSFTHANGTSETFTGAAIDSLFTSVDANGNQHTGDANGRLTFTFTNAVTGVQLGSSSNSFEISNFATAVVPEPASWALMLVGFGGLGGVLRRRRAVAAVA